MASQAGVTGCMFLHRVQTLCRAAIGLHVTSLLCELAIIAATISTVNVETDLLGILFVVASALCTLVLTYFNITGSATLLAKLAASASRLRDSVAHRMSRASAHGHPSRVLPCSKAGEDAAHVVASDGTLNPPNATSREASGRQELGLGHPSLAETWHDEEHL